MLKSVFGVMMLLVAGQFLLGSIFHNVENSKTPSAIELASGSHNITHSANCPTLLAPKLKELSLISASSTPGNPNNVSFSIIPSHDNQIDGLFINGLVVDFGDGTCVHPFETSVNCGEKPYCFAGAAANHTYATPGTYTAQLLVPITRCKRQDYETCLWQTISTTTISIEDDRSSRRSQ